MGRYKKTTDLSTSNRNDTHRDVHRIQTPLTEEATNDQTTFTEEATNVQTTFTEEATNIQTPPSIIER